MKAIAQLDSSARDPGAHTWRRPLGQATRILRAAPDGVTSLHDAAGRSYRDWSSPLPAIQWLQAQRQPGHRWVGFFSYDLAHWLDDAMPATRPDLPPMIFSEHPLLENPGASGTTGHIPPATNLRSNFSRDQYIQTIQKAIDYIAAGDIFQVNLAQQYRADTSASPARIYQQIQQHFPAWYAARLEYDEFALISNSPELFFRTWHEGSQNHIETRPIKGTRPRGEGMAEQLRRSEKDQAELNMIVDLERNDLGRICQLGSVKVVHARQIEEHPTVYHGSATVTGNLRAGTDLLDILKAMFPGGSITGAPKIRAMQIIAELEPDVRGPYCGAIGYLDADGQMQFNIAIRTMIIQNGVVRIPVGGGIVADSIPELEHAETLVKAAAALASLGINCDP